MAGVLWPDSHIQQPVKSEGNGLCGGTSMSTRKPENSRNMKRRRKGPNFIMLEHPLFDSEAFNSLSGSAVRVLLSIMRCKNGSNGTTDNPIICPHDSMNGRMSRTTIGKAIRELERIGFIERTQHGGLYKQLNLFALSGDWINWRQKNRTQVQKLDIEGSENGH